MTFTPLGKAIMLALVVGSMAYPVWLWQMRPAHVNDPRYFSSEGLFREDMNRWLGLVGTTVACLTLLAVAVRAAGSISGERDRCTFDILLTTPLQPQAILNAKWVGCIVSVRAGWLFLGIVWIVASLLGGLQFLSFAWLVHFWFVYAAFTASLGQHFSLMCSTTTKATLMTLATLAVLTLGHWLPWMFWEPPRRSPLLSARSPLETIYNFQAFGLTPPVALGWYAYHSHEFLGAEWDTEKRWEILRYMLAGQAVWLLAAVMLWYLNHREFAALTGRGPRSRVGVSGPPA